MSPPPQLKRQLLREAVADNLSTIEGRPAERRPAQPAPAPENRPAYLLWVAAFVLVLLPAGYILWLGSTAEADAAVDQAAVEAEMAPHDHIPIEDLASQLVFPAPRPIDPRVFSFEVRNVVIDPGHGGRDHGTVSNGLREKELTLDIAERLRRLLQKQAFEVHLTREGDETLSLRQRAEFANQLPADLFISIHINWLSTRQVRGIETYYLGPTDDPELTEFARRENRQSGYSLAEMRPLLEGLYTDVLQAQSRRFAQRIQRSLFGSLLRVNPELRNRGIKTAPFVVLVSTEMPAILAEVSCLSNAEEAELLTRPLYREHIAEALARGVERYADDVNQSDDRGI